MQAISCNARFDPAPLHKEDAAAAAQVDNYFVLFLIISYLSICFFTPPAVRFAGITGKPRGRGKDNAAEFITHGNDKRN